MINKEFIPYELALKLKELGFDIKTIAYYDMEGVFYPMGTVVSLYKSYFGIFIPKYQYKDDLEPLVAAPLYQQAFDWFREVHNLDATIRKVDLKGRSYWNIKKIETEEKIKGYSNFTLIYEEAKIECIKKLIELI